MMTVGFAATQGTAQHSRASGQPPYLMAMTEGAEAEAEFVEFLAGGTPTPIPCRYCLPIEILHEILAPFIQDGSLSQAVNWEEI
jgi:hypothetical protein